MTSHNEESIDFRIRAQAYIMLLHQVGEQKFVEFCVHQDDAIKGLTRNNESFVLAYHEAAEHRVQLTAFGVGPLARLGKLFVRLGWWLAKVGAPLTQTVGRWPQRKNKI